MLGKRKVPLPHPTPTADSFMPIAASTLDDFDTIESSQADDLKLVFRDNRVPATDPDPVSVRYWLSRMTLADGAEFDRAVTIEVWRYGVLVDSLTYEGAA